MARKSLLFAGVLLLVFFSSLADAEECSGYQRDGTPIVLSTNSTDDEGSGDEVEVMKCPNDDYPANHTVCCISYEDPDIEEMEEDGEDDYGLGANSTKSPKVLRARCCVKEIKTDFLDWLLGLDPLVSMIVALSVSGTLLLFTILIIICCFWSKCPLYTTCRVKYDKDDIIASARDEETANLTDMPEEGKEKSYSPNEVKVTTLNEEEEPCLKKEANQEEEQPLVEKKEDKKEDKKKEDKKKEEKKKEEKKKEEKKKEEKKKEEKKKEEKKKEEKKKDDKKKEEKKEEAEPEKKEEKKDEAPEKKEEPEEKKEEEKKE